MFCSSYSFSIYIHLVREKNYVLRQVSIDWDKETLDFVGNQWFRELLKDDIE